MLGNAEHELTGKGSAVIYPDDQELHRVGMESASRSPRPDHYLVVPSPLFCQQVRL